MAGEYYPTGPFIRKRARDDEFERAREDFLLEFAERTARAYKADLEDFRDWCLANAVDPMAPLSSKLDEYVEDLKSREYSPGTIGRRRAALRGFFAHLVATGKLEASPMDGHPPQQS